MGSSCGDEVETERIYTRGAGCRDGSEGRRIVEDGILVSLCTFVLSIILSLYHVIILQVSRGC